MSGNPWNQTFSGRAFDLVNPEPSMVAIKDIAQSLANQCRFNGHTRRYYSVAEHCLYVSRAMPTRQLRLIALLHDATEAYVGDMTTPLKALLPDFRVIEHRIWQAVCGRFRLPEEILVEVQIADQRMLSTEREYLLSPSDRPWGTMLEPFELHEIGLCHPNQFGLPPREAHRRFLERFAELAA
uniref:Phosphohydrolase n=1 Tax=Desulfovibrio sp. U5L TaxID=596152 RepID=I2Q2Q9_9BACT